MAEPQSLAISEVDGWSLLLFAGWGGPLEFDAAVSMACGFAVPREVGEVRKEEMATLIRIGPDRFWLVDDAGRDFAGLGCDPAIASITHLSEGRVRFRLTGTSTLAVLSRCIALDWDDPRLATGRAAQTMLHRVPVLIVRLGDDTFDLYVPRSFARNVREWIADAAARP